MRWLMDSMIRQSTIEAFRSELAAFCKVNSRMPVSQESIERLAVRLEAIYLQATKATSIPEPERLE
jgi:hypothetical protein